MSVIPPPPGQRGGQKFIPFIPFIPTKEGTKEDPALGGVALGDFFPFAFSLFGKRVRKYRR